MINRIYLTFDKSDEDIPTIVCFTESWNILASGPSMQVQNIITGDRAIRLWNELTKKEKEKKNDLRLD